LDCQQRAFPTFHFPRVVAKIKLAQITVQVLFTCMVIYTIDTSLENGKVALNCVCADKHITFFTGVGNKKRRAEGLPFLLLEALRGEIKNGKPLGPFLSRYDVLLWLRLDDRYDETESVRADPESVALRLNRRKPVQ
jgi:hypothetical protein